MESRKKCSYGKSGKIGGTCPFSHPKICHWFSRGGNKKDGWKKGGCCEFYQPKVYGGNAAKGDHARGKNAVFTMQMII